MILLLFVLALFLKTSDAFFWRNGRYSEVPPLELSSTDYTGKIIIIGAGPAGISAAYTLEYLGFQNYQILEANAEIGGRVQEMDDFIDLPLDSGAEWIHTHPRILQDMILFDDVVTEETIVYRPKQYRWAVFRDRIKVPLLFRRFFYREWKFKRTTWKSYLSDYMYTYVQDRVQVGAPVQAIDYTGAKIQITTTNGDIFEADKVIVAVPPTMLQSGNIDFIPDLPSSKAAEINKVEMYEGFKIWFEFDDRFYQDYTIIDSYRIYFDGVLGKPTQRNVLTMLSAGGEVTGDLVKLSDDSLFQFHMKELDQLFRGKATEHYVQHRIQNWSKEPFIKETWEVGYNSRFDEGRILQPIDEKIYFCGGYLSGDHYATVHGAILSGREVAQKALKDAA
jgi:monoamine oxidase